MTAPRLALLLTGGGARAAYQVGVLSALASLNPRTAPNPFAILCGTSAGAINVTALACYASNFQLASLKLRQVWQQFSCQQVFSSTLVDVSGHLSRQLLAPLQASYADKPHFSLLDNQPLRQLLDKVMDYQRIDRNLMRGHLSALSIAASSLTDGNTVNFVQSLDGFIPWQRARRRSRHAMISSEHLLASSALPGIFPASRIGEHFYADGSIHQLSPLSPAIHLQAEKILVISLEQPRKVNTNLSRMTASVIATHLLDTVFTDTLHSDLERLSRINQTLSMAGDHRSSQRQGALRPVETYVIKPSQSFDAIALACVNSLPITVRTLLTLVGIRGGTEGGGLASYLLFERPYTEALIAMGYQDTLAQKDALMHFLQH